MINALKIDSKDNVVVAIEHIKAGDTVSYRDFDGSIKELKALDNVRIYHKIALVDIPKDEFIIKYGEHMGVATEDIKRGAHVHVQNTEGRRENLEERE